MVGVGLELPVDSIVVVVGLTEGALHVTLSSRRFKKNKMALM